jgi:hypothetical protein
MAGHRWRHWVAVMSVLVALGLVTVTLTELWRSATQDRPELIDHPVVVRTSNAACLVMRKSVHGVAPPPEAPIRVRVSAIRAQNQAVLGMLEQIRRVGPERMQRDVPLLTWMADWEQLVRARETYAAALAAGHQQPLKLPADPRGQPIIARMNSVGLDCTVPPELTSTS